MDSGSTAKSAAHRTAISCCIKQKNPDFVDDKHAEAAQDNLQGNRDKFNMAEYYSRYE